MAKNLMPTKMGDIKIRNWDEMLEEHTTRALILLAFYNFSFDGIAPTKRDLIDEVREYQKERGLPILSLKSTQTTQRHIDKLFEDGYIIKFKFAKFEGHDKKKRPRGRGSMERRYWPAMLDLNFLKKEKKDEI